MSDVPVEGDYLIQLLAALLNNQKSTEPPNDISFYRLYRLANFHSVANMAYYGLQKLENQPSQESIANFFNAFVKAIAKEATQQAEIEGILEDLEKNQIRCTPLKGYIIKHLYPSPDMRSMGDIDILADPENMLQVKDIMVKKGYEVGNQGRGNHYSFFKKPVMNIEYHPKLIDERFFFTEHFNPGWQYATLCAGSKYVHKMTDEGFYIYMIAHMAAHYLVGGS